MMVFCSVLSWLKGLAPLTPEQLDVLFITNTDFEVSCISHALFKAIHDAVLSLKLALKHVQPSSKREGFVTVPGVTWDDIGAMHAIREELQMSILVMTRFCWRFMSMNLITRLQSSTENSLDLWG